MVLLALSSLWCLRDVWFFSRLPSATFLWADLVDSQRLKSPLRVFHLFGFSSSDLISSLSPSSLLLLDKYILQSMCTLKDDSRLDRWVWPLRAQYITVGWMCWRDFLKGGNKLQSISEEGKRVQNPVFSEKYYVAQLFSTLKNISWTPNYHIKMISEWSCDTEDTEDWKFCFAITGIN